MNSGENIEIHMKENTVNVPQRHHYVPKFYLSFFRSQVQRGRNPLIWVYEKEGPKPRLESVRKAAVEIDLNTLQIGGLPNTQLESLMASLEHRVKPIFERWHELGVQEKPCLIETVAEYLAFQYLRVPRSLNLMSDAMVASVNDWINSLRDNATKLNALWNQMIEDGNVPEGLTLEDVREDLKNHRNRPSLTLYRWAALSFSILQCEDVANSLVSMHWKLVRAESPEQFITSDCPVCPCAIEGSHAMVGSLFSHPSVEVTFSTGS
jgi:uncharacterized protein DUF4238